MRRKTDALGIKNENGSGIQETSGLVLGQRGRRAGTLEDMLGLEVGGLEEDRLGRKCL